MASRTEEVPLLEPQFTIQLRNPKKSLTLLGIHVEHSDGQRLLVEWIAEQGLFTAWNTAHPWQQVEVGDRIISVNGKTGTPRELIKELGKHEVLEIGIMKQGEPAKPNSAGQPGSVRPEPRMADGGKSDALVHVSAGTRTWKPPPPPVATAAIAAPAGMAEDGEEYDVVLHNPRKSLTSLGLHVDHSDGKTLLIECIKKGIFEAWNQANPEEQIVVGDRIIKVNGESGNAIKLANLLGKQEELRLTLRRAKVLQSVYKEEATQPQHVDEKVTGRMLYTYPLDVSEQAMPEDGVGGGPRWFRVVHHPHVPSRVKPDRDALIYTALKYCEVIEASLVDNGWARLAPAELWRRGLPQEDEAWALIDATQFGLGLLLSPMLAPPRRVAEAGTVILWSRQGQEGPSEIEMPGEATPSSAINAAERVVAENDKAWELLQERRRRMCTDGMECKTVEM